MKLEVSENNRINLLNVIMGIALFVFTPMLFSLFANFKTPFGLPFSIFVIILFLLETYAITIKIISTVKKNKISASDHPEISIFIYLYYLWSMFTIMLVAGWSRLNLIEGIAAIILVLQIIKNICFSAFYHDNNFTPFRNIGKSEMLFCNVVLAIFVFINTNILMYLVSTIWHIKADLSSIIAGSIFFAFLFIPLQLPQLLDRVCTIKDWKDYWLYWLSIYWLSLSACLQLLRI
ncbi:MAG: hypothetical protein WC890_02250 [Candidatus Margulisiibacteriota bacterium]